MDLLRYLYKQSTSFFSLKIELIWMSNWSTTPLHFFNSSVNFRYNFYPTHKFTKVPKIRHYPSQLEKKAKLKKWSYTPFFKPTVTTSLFPIIYARIMHRSALSLGNFAKSPLHTYHQNSPANPHTHTRTRIYPISVRIARSLAYTLESGIFESRHCRRRPQEECRVLDVDTAEWSSSSCRQVVHRRAPTLSASVWHT